MKIVGVIKIFGLMLFFLFIVIILFGVVVVGEKEVEIFFLVIFVLLLLDDVVCVLIEFNIMFVRRFFCCDEFGYWRVVNSLLLIKEVVLFGFKLIYDSIFII